MDIAEESLTRTGQPSSRLIYHKVCLAGVPHVGKTSFFLLLKNGEFPDPSRSFKTNAIDTLSIVRKVDGQDVGLMIHDTMGLEKLGSLTSNYYRGASCILLMFSVDDASSLDQLDDIMTESFTYSNYDNCHLVLVATKCDKKSEIDQGTIESRRIKHDLKLYIISSKNNQGIDTLLDDVARMVKTRKTGTIRLGSYPNITKTSGSCSC